MGGYWNSQGLLLLACFSFFCIRVRFDPDFLSIRPVSHTQSFFAFFPIRHVYLRIWIRVRVGVGSGSAFETRNGQDTKGAGDKGMGKGGMLSRGEETGFSGLGGAKGSREGADNLLHDGDRRPGCGFLGTVSKRTGRQEACIRGKKTGLFKNLPKGRKAKSGTIGVRVEACVELI